MKTLKLIFTLLIFSTVIYSCTPEAIDEDQTNAIDNVQATGEDGAYVDDGSKD